MVLLDFLLGVSAICKEAESGGSYWLQRRRISARVGGWVGKWGQRESEIGEGAMRVFCREIWRELDRLFARFFERS